MKYRIKEIPYKLADDENYYHIDYNVQVYKFGVWITIKRFRESYKHLAKELLDLLNDNTQDTMLPTKYYMK